MRTAALRQYCARVTNVRDNACSTVFLGAAGASGGKVEVTARGDAGDVPMPVRTVTGVPLSVVLPLPSCPALLPPQALRVPPDMCARLWFPPAEMARAPVRLTTAAGVPLAPPVLPLPSCPSSLRPQALTVPLDSSARLKVQPAATAVTPLSSRTVPGVRW